MKAAPALLGWRLYTQDNDGQLVGGMITETEAYTEEDAASHSYNGQTPRNSAMFGPAGHLYVYFTYGMHWCANIVAGPKGRGEAVLLRSLIPDRGLDRICKRRHERPDNELTNGPAKLCQALNITAVDNGAVINEGRFILLPPQKRSLKYRSLPRVGINRDVDRLWRFVLDM